MIPGRLPAVSFLGWHGQFPLAVALLAAALIESVLALILGSTRILQLMRAALRSRRERGHARVTASSASQHNAAS